MLRIFKDFCTDGACKCCMNSHMWQQIRWSGKRLFALGQLNGFSPVWTLKSLCKSPDPPKLFVHREHANFFSPVWTFKFEHKLDDCENDFEHSNQVRGFSRVWTLKCEHWGQTCGFSPVWNLKCLCKAWESPKFFVQREHANDVSPVWTLICERKSDDWENELVHRWQTCGFSPVWTIKCLCNWWESPKIFVQRVTKMLCL